MFVKILNKVVVKILKKEVSSLKETNLKSLEKVGKIYLVLIFVVMVSICITMNTKADEVSTVQAKKEIVVLYTNDAHNAYLKDDGCLGYASVAAYKKQLESEGHQVVLVDGGDAIQGGVIGALSKGQYIADIMGKTGYSVAIPGNHEFDFGMDNFLNIASKSDYEYVSCNFMDLRTNETVFKPYKMVSFEDVDVAFVGITTPKTYTSSTPKYFQDENGNYIYGFCEGGNGQALYSAVQESIDNAINEGAEYVVAIGHAGIEEECKPWTSKDIVNNVTGLDAFLDAHSHSTIEGDSFIDKAGNEVKICSTGTKLSSLGKLVIKEDGTIETELITEIETEDEETLKFVNEITKEFEELVNTVVAETEVDLAVNDPVTGERMVRSQETNLGDLCADAYRAVTGADVGLINGGGVRENIKKGEITYGDIISVNPFGNAICMVEAKGQNILDALEMGAIMVGKGEDGGFLHVSGLTYEIDTTIPSSIECNDKGEFVRVAGEYRVKNVKIAGESLDLTKTYKVASHNYLLKNGGGGSIMFKECKILLDEIILDNEALIMYISDNLNCYIKADSIYANPYGEGRIKILTEQDKEGIDNNIQQNNSDNLNNQNSNQNSGNNENGNSSEENSHNDGLNNDKSDLYEKAPVTGDEESYILFMFMICATVSVVLMNKNRENVKDNK